MTDGIRMETRTVSREEREDICLRVPTSCNARYLLRHTRTPGPHGRDPAPPNTNRFSDPLAVTRAGLVKFPVGLMKVARSQKAHTWYLDNGLPWRQKATSSGPAYDDSYSLFGDCTGSQHEVPNYTRKGFSGSTLPRTAESLAVGRHVFNTWERCRRGMLETNCVTGGSWKAGQGRRSQQSLSPLLLSQRSLSPLSISQHSPSPLSLNQRPLSPLRLSQNSLSTQGSRQSLSPHSQNQRSSPLTQRSSPNSLSPRSSPCSSQRSSPRGQRANQGLYQRTSPSRIPSVFPGATFRSSNGTQWEDNSSSHSSAFASSAGWSSREDVNTSYGSETDDDFLYVSCQQLTRGLADLSFSPLAHAATGTVYSTGGCMHKEARQNNQDLTVRYNDPNLAIRPSDRSPRHGPLWHHQHHLSPQNRLSPGYHHPAAYHHLQWNHQSPGQHVLENPAFHFSAHDDFYEDDDVFEDCSDDALSDDVFLDNPDPQVTHGRASPRCSGAMSKRLDGRVNPLVHAATGTVNSSGGYTYKGVKGAGDGDRGCLNDAEVLAVESLRRNSLQNKRRLVWQERRARTPGRRLKQFSFSGQSPRSPRIASHTSGSSRSFESVSVSSSPRCLPSAGTKSCIGLGSCNRKVSPASRISSPIQSSLTSSTPNSSRQRSSGVALDARSPAYDAEGKRCFHYVISPTDDVDMPEVIAVRKSSVELIRWQNSLRRRRRRQAKRHDLGTGRSKTRELLTSSVASTM